MIKYVERILKKIGWVPPFDHNDVLNAEIEDTERHYSGVIERLHQSFYRRLRTNADLRSSIQIAKRRTTSFSDFEGRIRGTKND
jgi:hypothetical protein